MSDRFASRPRPPRRSDRSRLVIVGVLAVGTFGLVALTQLGGLAPAASPSVARVASASGSATAGSSPLRSPVGSAGVPGSSPSQGTSPSLAPTPVPIVVVPIVPVADYRTTATAITKRDVDAVLAGTSRRWTMLELVVDQSKPILDALQLSPAAGRIVIAPDAARLMADLAAHRDRLAFLRADEVGPGIRALGWGVQRLFGVHRLKSVGVWPLTALLPAASRAPYDPATTWTLFAAGDLGLDRTYAYVVKNLGKGMDYPFDGGTARIAVSCAAPRSAGRCRRSSRPVIQARCAT